MSPRYELALESIVSLFVNFSEAPEHIKAHFTLSATIINYGVPLKLQGREWVGICPFHEEKTPSFSVNDAKGLYFCRGCHAKGDVISFVADRQGMTKGRVIRALADQMGLKINAKPQKSVNTKANLPAIDRSDRELITQVHDHLAQIAHRILLRTLELPNDPITQYLLVERGFSIETIRQYGLGYLPHDADLPKLATAPSDINTDPLDLSRGHWEVLAIEAGLLKDLQHRSMFQGRLLFPIIDSNGQCIALSGRVIEGLESRAMIPQSKYLNSPETFIFDKSRTVFGMTPWHFVLGEKSVSLGWRRRLAEQRWSLVEGYTDVMRLAENGVMSVAAMGTAVTPSHLGQLMRRTDELCILTDGDSAGQNAWQRALLHGLGELREGQSLYAAHLPEGEDPDSYFADISASPGPGEHFWHLVAGLPRALPEEIWFSETIGEVATPVCLADQVRIERALSGKHRVPLPRDPMMRLALVRFVADQTGYYTRPLATIRSAYSAPADQQQWVVDDAMRFWLYRISRAPEMLHSITNPWKSNWWVRDSLNGLLAPQFECPAALRIIFQAGMALSRLDDQKADSWPTLVDALRQARFPSALLVTWAEIARDGDRTLKALGYEDEVLAPDLWEAEFNDWVSSVDGNLNRQLLQAVSLSDPD